MPTDFAIPDTTVSVFRFTGMYLYGAVPALQAIVSGPPGITATLNISVFLYETPSSPTPYATAVFDGLQLSPGNPHAAVNIDNGQQPTTDGKSPAKIEIQVQATTAILAGNTPVVLA